MKALPPTPLQTALQAFAAALDVAVTVLDEREWSVYIDIVTERIASENGREWRRDERRAA